MEKNNAGQAIFEFILFVPIFVFLIIIIYVIGNAINASINQQKTTRSYFYFTTSHNSFAPSYRVLEKLQSNLELVSQDSIGWKEDGLDNSPVAECFPLPTFFQRSNEQCNVAPTNQKTRMIRIYTVYGTCTATYRKLGNKFLWMPVFKGAPLNWECLKQKR